MNMTRTVRDLGRPAASCAGRVAAHVLLVITLVVGVVFAHGGACAAVELAESASHSAHLEKRASGPVDHGGGCLHNNLPEHHRHGTEQDCSASAPAGSTPYMAMLGTLSVSAPRTGAEAPSDFAAGVLSMEPCLRNLCVMRI